jgi:hypothetical protein
MLASRPAPMQEASVKKPARKRKRRVVMESEVLNFLTRLATEPELYGAWLRDPGAALKKGGLDEKSRQALTSGDAMQVHRAISAKMAADEKALEESMARAKQVAAILEGDPTVALWIQSHYYQTLMAWLGGASAAASGAQPTQAGSTPTGYA